MKKILIVDDENLILYSLSATFKNDDTDIVTAATGEAALRAIRENRFEACLLDIHLPDINGLDIMKHLRDVSPNTRIVIMTGSELTEDMMASIRQNAQMVITKPFDLDGVKTFVDEIIARGRPCCRDTDRSFDDHCSFIKWLAEDGRKHLRKPVSKNITYVAVTPKSEKTAILLTGDILDISEGGMCMRTDSKLQPGYVLRFSDVSAQCRGVVRWIMEAGTGRAHHVGVQFVGSEGDLPAIH